MNIIGLNLIKEIEKAYPDSKGYKQKILKAPKEAQRYLLLNILYYNEYMSINNPFIRNIRKEAFIENLDLYLDMKLSDHYMKCDQTIQFLRTYMMISEEEKYKYGEIHTPDFLIDEQLSEYDKIYNDWNPDSKFLFIASGIGTYVVKVIKKLLHSEKMIEFLPDFQQRYKYIIENQIYINELQERNLVLYLFAIDPKSQFSHNIFSGDFLSEEYDFNHQQWDTKFTCIFTHPPYKKETDLMPFYNIFFDKCIKLVDKVMILMPSKWFSSGNGELLKQFRSRIIEMSCHIPFINHKDDYGEVFQSSFSYYKKSEDNKKVRLNMDGGICYLLYDQNYIGNTFVNGQVVDLNKYDIILPNNKYDSILQKVFNKTTETLSKIYQADGDSAFAIKSNDPRLLTELPTDNPKEYMVCHVSRAKGNINYIHRDYVKKGKTNYYKVITINTVTSVRSGFGSIVIGYPDEVLNQSLIFFETKDEAEAISLKSYLETKLVNLLLVLRKRTKHISKVTIQWIPLLSLNEKWTDDKLNSYFGFTPEEISLINDFI